MNGYPPWLKGRDQTALRELYKGLTHSEGAKTRNLLQYVHVPRIIIESICKEDAQGRHMAVLRDYIKTEFLYLDRYKPPHERLGLEGEVWVMWRLLCDGLNLFQKESGEKTQLEQGMMTAEQFEVRHAKEPQHSLGDTS